MVPRLSRSCFRDDFLYFKGELRMLNKLNEIKNEALLKVSEVNSLKELNDLKSEFHP